MAASTKPAPRQTRASCVRWAQVSVSMPQPRAMAQMRLGMRLLPQNREKNSHRPSAATSRMMASSTQPRRTRARMTMAARMRPVMVRRMSVA